MTIEPRVLGNRVDYSFDVTATLHWSYYSSSDIYEREQRLLFGGSWHYVGNINDLPQRVSSFPTMVVGVPVVLTRDASDNVSALVNVCAHRGTIVCSAPATRDTLVCPYHAWRYDLGGLLRSAPRSDREPGFDRSQHRLDQLRTGLWGPFLFVAVSDDAPGFTEWIADIPDRVVAAGIDVDTMEFHSRATSDLDANWKVCVENFLECYHCRIAHPGFSKAIDTSPDEYLLETAPTYSTQYGPVRANWTGPFDPRGPVGRGQFHLLFPNTVINIMPGHPNLSIGPVVPTGPATTKRSLDYFFGPDIDPRWITEMLAFDNQVGAEDTVLVEAMQRGLSARPDRRGTLFMDSERLIAHFDEHITAVLGD